MKKIFLLSLLLSSFASAQQRQEARKYFRVLSLGDLPPWEEELIDGVRTQIPPPAGSVPPSPLAITTSPGEVMAKSNPLGRISRPYQFNAALEKLELSKGPQAGGKKWTTLKPPRSSHSLLLCWRKHRAKTWDNAQTKYLPDSPRVFPKQKMRIINISDQTASVVFNGGKVKRYGPGKGAMLSLKVGKNTIVVKIPGKNGKVYRLYDNTIEVAENERVNAIIYRSDGVSPRRPAKIWVQQEEAKAYQPQKPGKPPGGGPQPAGGGN